MGYDAEVHAVGDFVADYDYDESINYAEKNDSTRISGKWNPKYISCVLEQYQGLTGTQQRLQTYFWVRYALKCPKFQCNVPRGWLRKEEKHGNTSKIIVSYRA